MTSDFFHAVNELHELGFDETQTSAKQRKLKICPNDSLNFPARDVYELVHDEDEVRVICYFMGLYGVDSPLPIYINERCLKQDKLGVVLREFLDVLNHRNYSLYFQALRAFYPEMIVQDSSVAGYAGFLESLSGYSPGPLAPSCIYVLGRNNLASLLASMELMLPGIRVNIYDFKPAWVTLDGYAKLGSGLKLADTSFLGEQIYDTSHGIRIELGPMHFHTASQFFSGEKIGAALIHMLRETLQRIAVFELHLRHEVEDDYVTLGQSPGRLGQQTWLGDWPGGYYSIKIC